MIAKAVEIELGERRGGNHGNQFTGGKTQNFADSQTGKESAEIAAKKAGFGNKDTYRQATSIFMTAEMTAIMKLFW